MLSSWNAQKILPYISIKRSGHLALLEAEKSADGEREDEGVGEGYSKNLLSWRVRFVRMPFSSAERSKAATRQTVVSPSPSTTARSPIFRGKILGVVSFITR